MKELETIDVSSLISIFVFFVLLIVYFIVANKFTKKLIKKIDIKDYSNRKKSLIKFFINLVDVLIFILIMHLLDKI
ncbi:hypothetical protein [Miniphocaeibacter halophilus]|uniref:Uncharacterized protein n=1 Tax=Miniphocaeibacter halophilus TaxID=2931922 RepID=A0AC61NF26_9FIRM|nr:hypothetical protein [Miniphocaeibacter halophilus]QQK08873.1 hypothetical protein JFY71_04885 [Miniphocaeibacter halophilus]